MGAIWRIVLRWALTLSILCGIGLTLVHHASAIGDPLRHDAAHSQSECGICAAFHALGTGVTPPVIAFESALVLVSILLFTALLQAESLQTRYRFRSGIDPPRNR
ncbi:MAG: hypothetical protein U0136_18690 [Bdellovibrionota bacterium]